MAEINIIQVTNAHVVFRKSSIFARPSAAIALITLDNCRSNKDDPGPVYNVYDKWVCIFHNERFQRHSLLEEAKMIAVEMQQFKYNILKISCVQNALDR